MEIRQDEKNRTHIDWELEDGTLKYIEK